MADAGICDRATADAIARAADRVTPQEVAEEETKTRHDVRALVNVIRAQVPDDAKRFVHLGATSYDIVDTANALRYRECVERVVVPAMGALVARCISIAEAEADTPQIGRTHGRHAEPITFGFAMAEYVSRLGDRIEVLRSIARRLPGKLSGAVGAYSAMGLLDAGRADAREAIPRGARPSSALELDADRRARGLDGPRACLRHRARRDGESRRRHAPAPADGDRRGGRVLRGRAGGSSTMPHKRNPVSFENVKSIWKAMAPRVMTTYLDQISEHQRDLTNSASQRFLGEIIASTAYAAGRMAGSLEGIRVDRDRLKANLAMSRGAIVAEPLYVLLAKYGHPDAHEAVRRLTLEAERGSRSILEVVATDTELRDHMTKFSPEERRILERPEDYRGLAAEVARDVATTWRERLKGVLPE